MIVINPYRFAVAPSTLLTGLTASYSLDGNATKNVGTYDGTATNVTYTTGSISGQCGYFNGTGKISITDSSDYTTSTSDFALSIRVKRNLSGTREAFHGQTNSSGQDPSISFILEFQTANTIRFLGVISTGVYAIVTSASTITDTNWHNIVVQRNGTSLELYIDGVLNATATGQFTSGQSLQDSTQNMGIGNAGALASLFLTGYIQDVHFWKGRKLTSTEITDLQTKRYPFL